MQVGQPVNGTDIIPAFDHSVEILGDKAILVYPQSTGEAGNGTPDEGQGAKYRQVSTGSESVEEGRRVCVRSSSSCQQDGCSSIKQPVCACSPALTCPPSLASLTLPSVSQHNTLHLQFWRIPFWRCSVGICRDPSIDDMGFIEKVVADLPKRLPLKPGHVSVSVVCACACLFAAWRPWSRVGVSHLQLFLPANNLTRPVASHLLAVLLPPPPLCQHE